jgi:glycosyltransferase involved in cell wall biosynthesis
MGGDADDTLEPIRAPYLLVSGVPCFVDEQGRRWTDALWHKDLVEHLRYIKNFKLAAPMRRDKPPPGAICLTDDLRFVNVEFVDLPASDSLLAAMINWPATMRRLWHSTGRVRVVHAGVAEWPIPTGWAATLAARLRRRALVINVESAFWRVEPSAPWRKRVRGAVMEAVNRWCVRQATIPMFTQPEYAVQMLRDPSAGYISHASWIDQDVVLSEEEAHESWNEKEGRALTVLFAGRLSVSKGLTELLEASAQIANSINVDIVGAGELKTSVLEATRQLPNVRLLDPVTYGPDFFELVRRYHAVIVPSRSDEQPRIVYDAYSQAVPIIGSRTAGIATCVLDGETGNLVTPQSVPALVAALDRANRVRASLRRMGMNGLLLARKYTHGQMHRSRRSMLKQSLGI